MRLDKKETINRLVIYFFYDADGIVDRYVPYILEDIKKNCSEIFVVCNGKLTSEGRATFSKITSNILVRENKGFDVWAYKTALEYYGWEKLAEYDEVVMMNHTIMGPVYPFSEMFEEMDKRDLDFWGITKHHKLDFDPFRATTYGYVPEHIQSHFVAVRNSMLVSLEFRHYWETRRSIESYGDAIGKHEAIFTKYFSDIGFRWEVFVDTSDMDDFTYYPLQMDPIALLETYRCPIFKRRSFFHDYYDLLSNTSGSQGKVLLEYLKKNSAYDVDMIWENILRTSNMADVKNCLNLNYILPEKVLTQDSPSKRKTALVLHIYYEDLIPYCYKYALAMPPNSDIYVTTNSEEKRVLLEETFSKGPWRKVVTIRIENRGRDVSSLLVGVADYVDAYDYVCFAHDKKVTQLDLGIKGYEFSERCFKNLLGSNELVQNIISLFEEEPRMGLLFPPPPNHADYYPTLGYEWGPNFDVTQKLAMKLKLTCSIDRNKEPIAPLGTMFWFRPKALKKLVDYGWTYDDFPKEPNANDGTLLHGIERIYPFVAQDAGYYSAWVLSDTYMRTEWNNLAYMLREINMRAFQAYGHNNHYGLVHIMDYYLSHANDPRNPAPSTRVLVKRKIKSKIPKPIWSFMKKVYHLFGGKKWVG